MDGRKVDSALSSHTTKPPSIVDRCPDLPFGSPCTSMPWVDVDGMCMMDVDRMCMRSRVSVWI